MLRVTTSQLPDRLVLKLEGRLIAPWVREAEASWQATLAARLDRALEIDLQDVWGVDDEGRVLLERMHQAGAELVVRGCAMRELVREIRAAGVRA